MEGHFTSIIKWDFLLLKKRVINIVMRRKSIKWGLIHSYVFHYSLDASLSFILLSFKLQCELEKFYYEKYALVYRKKTIYFKKCLSFLEKFFVKDYTINYFKFQILAIYIHTVVCLWNSVLRSSAVKVFSFILKISFILQTL